MNHDLFNRLQESVYDENSILTQELIFELSSLSQEYQKVPDVLFAVLTGILNDERLYTKNAFAHVLNFFEFESIRLTQQQKRNLKKLLEEKMGEIKLVHSQQVISELLNGDYLE